MPPINQETNKNFIDLKNTVIVNKTLLETTEAHKNAGRQPN